MDLSKVQTIQDWPNPHKIKDIQSFLGFANFYRCLISDYSKIVVPLTRLMRKGVPWNFSDAARKSFEALKSAFTFAPILTHWLPDKQMIIGTDASDYALGAILSLQTDSGEIHPVAFHSCTSRPPNSTTIPTIKNCSRSSRLYVSGDTISKAPVFRSTLSWTTRTSNTFQQ
jgi:hypothetical protein